MSTGSAAFEKPLIADDVIIGAEVLLTNRLEIGSGVRIEQGVVFAENDAANTIIHSMARIGSGAVLAPGIEIGRGAHVLPGSVVCSSVPPNAIVQGNPAQIVGYTTNPNVESGTSPFRSPDHPRDRRETVVEQLGVGAAALYRMPRISDIRGGLTVGEIQGDFPFEVRRYFIVFDVPSEELRGEHAHRECHQFLICVKGACHALLDDGRTRKEVRLDQPDVALYMPPLIWGTQYRYTKDAALLVLASHHYEASDYIRNYDDFLKLVG